MTKSRNRTADLLKGAAVILMVQVHLVELFAQQQIYDSNLGSVLLFLGGPPAAPVFMTVMGYFIAQGNSSISKSFIRGFKLIMGGLLLNLGLNLHLFFNIYINSIDTSPWPYLFGVDILFLAGMSIILLSIFKRVFKTTTIPYLVIIIIIFLIQLLPYPDNPGIMQFITALIYSKSWWSYFPLVPWLVYPITGFVFFVIEPTITNYIRKQSFRFFIVALSGIILLSSISYGISIATNLHVYYHHNFIYFLFVVNFMIFWSATISLTISHSENIISGFVRWVGKNVTVFYVIQWIIIGNIATGLYKTQNGLQLLFWFLGIFISTSFLTYCYAYLKKG